MESFIISKNVFNSFHRIDRDMYSILTINLWRDPVESMQVMALWLCLERNGFRNIVDKLLFMPYTIIHAIAEETLSCLKILKDEQLDVADAEIPLLEILAEKDFSLQFLRQNRKLVSEGVDRVMNEVCIRAFSDIKQSALERNTAQSQPGLHNDASLSPEEERTLFVTFSKGNPVQELELYNYITRNYGNYIENLFMQEVRRDEQRLYAQVVFHHKSTIDMILNGRSTVKLTINRNHVWARKYMPNSA